MGMFEVRYVDAGVRLGVRDYGPGGGGHDIVLLHALGAGAAQWDEVATHLKAYGHRPVAMDMRGHGDTPPTSWSWEEVTSDVAAVIEQLALRRPAVIGHSLGGIVAALWADNHPECPLAVDIEGLPFPSTDPALENALLDMARGLPPQWQDVLIQVRKLDVVAAFRDVTCPLVVFLAEQSGAEVFPAAVQSAWKEYRSSLGAELETLASSTALLTLARLPGAHDPVTDEPTATVDALNRCLSAALPGP